MFSECFLFLIQLGFSNAEFSFDIKYVFIQLSLNISLLAYYDVRGKYHIIFLDFHVISDVTRQKQAWGSNPRPIQPRSLDACFPTRATSPSHWLGRMKPYTSGQNQDRICIKQLIIEILLDFKRFFQSFT